MNKISCPHCGRVIHWIKGKPSASLAPPGYTGYLGSFMAEILELYDTGKSPREITEVIQERVTTATDASDRLQHSSDESRISAIRASVIKVLKYSGRTLRRELPDREQKLAQDLAALKLHKAGKTYKQIAAELNVGWSNIATRIRRARNHKVKPTAATKVSLDDSISVLSLPVRAANCLKNNNIITIRELVQWSEADLLRASNFGRQSLADLTTELTRLGLSLGGRL